MTAAQRDRKIEADNRAAYEELRDFHRYDGSLVRLTEARNYAQDVGDEPVVKMADWFTQLEIARRVADDNPNATLGVYASRLHGPSGESFSFCHFAPSPEAAAEYVADVRRREFPAWTMWSPQIVCVREPSLPDES